MKAPVKLYSAWMGPGPMSPQRQKALISIVSHCAVPFHFVSYQNINSWQHCDFPLHPAFKFLSAVHQCDYLRCYLLHLYGGGYTDIKPTTHNWNRFFELHALSNKIGAGYTEISSQSVANVGGSIEIEMKSNYQQLIGVCSLIMTPFSQFTQEWFTSVNNLLDRNLEALQLNPARHPQDQFGIQFENGEISKYPLKWTELGGDIFHQLVYKYHDQFLHLNMAPSFFDYR
jgi:hypothetical protein